MSGYVRKFERGEPFETLDELAAWCARRQWVFWGRMDRPMHGLAFINMQFSHIAQLVTQRRVWRAAIRREWAEKHARGAP